MSEFFMFNQTRHFNELFCLLNIQTEHEIKGKFKIQLNFADEAYH
jgi:hypothetical protein